MSTTDTEDDEPREIHIYPLNQGPDPHSPARFDYLHFMPALDEDRQDEEDWPQRPMSRLRAHAERLHAREDSRGPDIPLTGYQAMRSGQESAYAILKAIVEVIVGARPVDHVVRWTSPDLFDALARRAGLARRMLGERRMIKPKVQRTSVQILPSGACEVSYLLAHGQRMRAAAARLERRRNRWVMTSLEIA